jgi:uncharacterized surface anchored protein
VTAADGTYSFTNLGPGSYFIQEEVPAGYTQTGGSSGYTIDGTSGVDSSGNNFDDYLTPVAGTNTIGGTKYTDLTGDGFSADDTPLSGVTIDLFFNGGTTPQATTVTAADGTYSFTNLVAGLYRVQEEVPTGYTETGGTAGYSSSFSGSGSHGTVGDDDFDDFQNMTIGGTKYTDITGDGASADDTPLGNVTIDLFKNGGATPFATTTTTVAEGSYIFSNLGPATYTVQEEVPAGYTETVGNSGYTVDPISGTISTQNNFENFKNITISGKKFKDLTDNGFSADDTALGGVTINLTGYIPIFGGIFFPIESTTTAPDGTYSFTNLGPGIYVVNETVPAGYTQTGGVGGYFIPATSGLNATGKNFDDYQTPTGATISGQKFNDITGNGITSDDTGLGGVTIKLYKNGSTTALATTTTAANGTYSFTNLAAATYKVVEVVPSGWTQTGGIGGYSFVVASGKTYTGKNFDDFHNISISGIKFNDITGNGFSTDDTHLGGVKIYLYKNSGTSPVASAITASNGTYSFTNLGPGTYKVQEVVPSGYIQTGGGPNGLVGNTYYSVAAHSGQNSASDNFDDYKIPTCKPINVYFTIDNGSTKYTTLTGHTHKGDTVKVTFTVTAGMSDQLSLVSYTAPGPTYNSSTANQQKIFQQATGTFAPGTHTLTIVIPKSDYQIDFICGPVISMFSPPNYGPDGGNIFYTPEHRLLSSDNG